MVQVGTGGKAGTAANPFPTSRSRKHRIPAKTGPGVARKDAALGSAVRGRTGGSLSPGSTGGRASTGSTVRFRTVSRRTPRKAKVGCAGLAPLGRVGCARKAKVG